MTKYIEIEELKKQNFNNFSITDIMQAIDNCPIANVEPIIHAHWMILKCWEGTKAICSACKKPSAYRKYEEQISNYSTTAIDSILTERCPRCGAIMDEPKTKFHYQKGQIIEDT